MAITKRNSNNNRTDTSTREGKEDFIRTKFKHFKEVAQIVAQLKEASDDNTTTRGEVIDHMVNQWEANIANRDDEVL